MSRVAQLLLISYLRCQCSHSLSHRLSRSLTFPLAIPSLSPASDVSLRPSLLSSPGIRTATAPNQPDSARTTTIDQRSEELSAHHNVWSSHRLSAAILPVAACFSCRHGRGGHQFLIAPLSSMAASVVMDRTMRQLSHASHGSASLRNACARPKATFNAHTQPGGECTESLSVTIVTLS
ncbi:hypothetical protein IWX49DRAFT_572540 [Phyllosticta citricarpa]